MCSCFCISCLHFCPNICTPAIGPVCIRPVLLHDQSFERHVTNLPWRALYSSRFTPSYMKSSVSIQPSSCAQNPSVFLVRPPRALCCTTCSHFPFRYALPIPPTTVQPHHRLQPTETPSHRREFTHKLLPSRQPFLQPVGDLLAAWAKRVLGISPVIFATYIRCLVFERRGSSSTSSKKQPHSKG